jgi:hypothetical protein
MLLLSSYGPRGTLINLTKGLFCQRIELPSVLNVIFIYLIADQLTTYDHRAKVAIYQ